VDAGFENQLLLSHDAAPYFYQTFWQEEKPESDWLHVKAHPWSLILPDVVPRLGRAWIPDRVIGKMLIENPKKVLAF
jgi:predicted metal-dependent phosphotriesterase family hydrolase